VLPGLIIDTIARPGGGGTAAPRPQGPPGCQKLLRAQGVDGSLTEGYLPGLAGCTLLPLGASLPQRLRLSTT